MFGFISPRLKTPMAKTILVLAAVFALSLFGFTASFGYGGGGDPPPPDPCQGVVCGLCQECQSGICEDTGYFNEETGGCDCFIGETEILMADGSTKKIAEVVLGDRVLSYNELTKKNEPAAVLKTFFHQNRLRSYLLINNVLGVTPNHPLWINEKWLNAGLAAVGDKLTAASGAEISIDSIVNVTESLPVYNLEVEGYHNYYAAGFLAHNKVIAACNDECFEPNIQSICAAGMMCLPSADGKNRCRNPNNPDSVVCCGVSCAGEDDNRCGDEGVCYQNKCRLESDPENAGCGFALCDMLCADDDDCAESPGDLRCLTVVSGEKRCRNGQNPNSASCAFACNQTGCAGTVGYRQCVGGLNCVSGYGANNGICRLATNPDSSACGFGGDYFTLLADPADASVDLSWSPSPVDLGYEKLILNRLNCDISSFSDDPSQGQKIYDGSGISYRDRPLINDRQYCYSAFAYRANGAIVEYSFPAFAQAVPKCRLDAVSGLSFASTAEGVVVSWLAPAESDGFGVIKIDGGSRRLIYDGSESRYLDTTVVSGEDYEYAVYAYRNDGCLSDAVNGRVTFNWSNDPNQTQSSVTLKFYTHDYSLEILPIDGTVNILAKSDLQIIGSAAATSSARLTALSLLYNGRRYPFLAGSSDGNFYLGLDDFSLPGRFAGEWEAIFDGQRIEAGQLPITVHAFGRVSVELSENEAEIDGAFMTAENDETGDIFTMVPADLVVSADRFLTGHYGLMVPNGRYFLAFVKNGVSTVTKTVVVNNNILNQDLVFAGPGLKKVIDDTIEIVQNFTGAATEYAIVINESFFDYPLAEKINYRYVAPAAVVGLSIGTLLIIPWWNLSHYLQLVFAEPLAWLFRRKRSGWGVVYNSITKEPVDLAVVRLYDRDNGKLLKSQITDKAGRYYFLVAAGRYFMEVVKPSFVFPSKILGSTSADEKYVDLYYGGEIVVKNNMASGQESGSVIVANIPIDQGEITLNNQQAIRQYFWRRFGQGATLVGPLFSVFSFLISPTWLIGTFTLIHLSLFFLFRRLAAIKLPRSWGMVFDKFSGRKLSQAVIRIFSAKYNKMLSVQVTDAAGRYGFLAGSDSGDYYLTVERADYERFQSNQVAVKKEKTEMLVAEDVGLKRIKNRDHFIG